MANRPEFTNKARIGMANLVTTTPTDIIAGGINGTKIHEIILTGNYDDTYDYDSVSSKTQIRLFLSNGTDTVIFNDVIIDRPGSVVLNTIYIPNSITEDPDDLTSVDIRRDIASKVIITYTNLILPDNTWKIQAIKTYSTFDASIVILGADF